MISDIERKKLEELANRCAQNSKHPGAVIDETAFQSFMRGVAALDELRKPRCTEYGHVNCHHGAEEAARKAWENHKDKNEPIGNQTLYYADNSKYFQLGYLAGWQQGYEKGKQESSVGDFALGLETGGRVEKLFSTKETRETELLALLERARQYVRQALVDAPPGREGDEYFGGADRWLSDYEKLKASQKK